VSAGESDIWSDIRCCSVIRFIGICLLVRVIYFIDVFSFLVEGIVV
jgi:hypothetical protein